MTSSGMGRGVVLSTVGYLASPLAGFISAPILAHALGVSGRGESGAATAPLILAMSMFTLGLPEALTYYVAKHPKITAAALGRATVIVVIVGVAASGIIIALAAPLAHGDPHLANLIGIAGLAVAPSLVLTVVRGVAIGQQLWGMIAVERTVNSVSRLVVVAVLAVFGGLNVFSATVTIAITGFASVVVYVLIPVIRRPPSFTTEEPPTVRLLSFGLRMWLGSFAGILLSRLDQTVMVPLSSTYELGLYVVAVPISELVLVFNSAVRDVVFSVESGDPDETRLALGSRVSTALTALSAAVVAVVGIWGIPWLFGAAFAPAVPVTEILLLGVVLGNPGSVAGSGLSARGRPELRSWSLVIAVVVNVILLLVLVPPFGAQGAAWATVAGNVIAGGLNIVWLRVYFAVPIGQFLTPRRSDITFVRQMLGGGRKRESVER